MFAIFFSAQFMLKLRYGSIPWPIILAALGILIGYLTSEQSGHIIDFGPDFQLQTLQSRFPNLTMSLLDPPHIDIKRYTFGEMQQLFSAACSIALVVILETLISARIAGSKTRIGICKNSTLPARMYAFLYCSLHRP
jgi:MFS superfamily sulfate permease-like transporter